MKLSRSDPCKILSNQAVAWLASKSANQLPDGRAVFLDELHLSTKLFLGGVGIPTSQMFSPNINKDVHERLVEAKVPTYLGAWEDAMKAMPGPNDIHTIYYDGCGSPVGNKKTNIFLGDSLDVALHHTIKQPDKMVTFAFTVCLRTGQKLPWGGSVANFVSYQMQNLVNQHGFMLHPDYHKIEITYRRSRGAPMGFFCWPLEYVGEGVSVPNSWIHWGNGRRICFRD